MMISARVHYNGNDILLAACDMALLGKEFKEGRMKLVVSRNFYEGMELDPQRFLEVLGTATIANLVGKETIDAAMEAGFLDQECIITIGGVPHAQMVVYEV